MLDDKKISLDELEELLENESGDEGGMRLNFQTIFSMLVLNWHWFLLSLIIFVCGALIYLRYAEPVYEVSARMLIKDENKNNNNNQMLAGIEDLGFLTNSSGFENELEVLKSRVLLRDVVKNLKLYTEYRAEGRIMKAVAYPNQPVIIDLDPVHLDSLDINLLEKTQWLDMKIWRENTAYVLSGNVMNGKTKQAGFQHRFDVLPATFPTELGTVTITTNPGKVWEPGVTYLVTIRPPMQVATEYLKKLTIAATSRQTSIAQFTLKDNNYRRGMDVLRQLVVSYNRQANADKNEVAIRTEEFINDRMAKIDEELGSTEGEIQEFKQQNAVTSLTDVSQSVQMSNEFSARLSEANSQVQILDYMREFVNNPDNKYQIIPSNVGMEDAASNALISQYNKTVLDRNHLLASASGISPKVEPLTKLLDELGESIKEALRQARRTADIARQGVEKQYNEYQTKITNAPEQERILTEIGRQQDVMSGLYLMLLQKREENSISLAATADKGRLIDEPAFGGKVSPKDAIILLVAIVLGLALPLLITYLIQFLRYKIEGHEDVMRLTDIPIVADVAIANEDAKTAAGIVVHENKNNQTDEIFRSMRTNIQFLMKENDKAILFTSSTSGEGKTFNAANLAVSFALLGKKTILLGLDIRKPALGRLFDIKDRAIGITSLLVKDKIDEEDLKSQIRSSGINVNLDLLLAGPTPPNPTELLARDNMKEIMDMLRKEYDYIILDTAPVGLVTDTFQIGQYADVTVYVCRADYTPKSSFGMINALKKEEKLPNMCLVINGIDMSKKKYGYYYGYGKYGKYGRYAYGYGYGRYGRYGYGSSYGSYGNYGNYNESHYGNKDDNSIKK